MAEGKRFSVFGQFMNIATCLALITAKGFSTNYLPNIKQFVPSPALPCVFEPIGPTAKERVCKGYKEIEPCEQPNELRIHRSGSARSLPRPDRQHLSGGSFAPIPPHRIDVPLLSVFLNPQSHSARPVDAKDPKAGKGSGFSENYWRAFLVCVLGAVAPLPLGRVLF